MPGDDGAEEAEEEVEEVERARPVADAATIDDDGDDDCDASRSSLVASAEYARRAEAESMVSIGSAREQRERKATVKGAEEARSRPAFLFFCPREPKPMEVKVERRFFFFFFPRFFSLALSLFHK